MKSWRWSWKSRTIIKYTAFTSQIILTILCNWRQIPWPVFFWGVLRWCFIYGTSLPEYLRVVGFQYFKGSSTFVDLPFTMVLKCRHLWVTTQQTQSRSHSYMLSSLISAVHIHTWLFINLERNPAKLSILIEITIII